ncbi:hypothetical protein LSAT2_022887 [Lamellibrachia satsuma]|nr:hypothetical protein LSAT2_022887 [Lamellibrachia satsuma]
MNVLQVSVILVGLLCLLIEEGQTVDHFGLVYAHDVDSEKNGHFCFMYNPLFKELPSHQEQAVELHLSDLSSSMLCDGSITTDVRDTAVAVKRGNCTFSEKALTVQAAGGVAVLIISHLALQQPVANSSVQYNDINITVALMHVTDFHDLRVSVDRGVEQDLRVSVDRGVEQDAN